MPYHPLNGRGYGHVNIFKFCRLPDAARRAGLLAIADPCYLRYGMVSVCPSVCLSQAGVMSKRLDGSGWFSAQRLPSAHSILCFRGIRVSSKN